MPEPSFTSSLRRWEPTTHLCRTDLDHSVEMVDSEALAREWPVLDIHCFVSSTLAWIVACQSRQPAGKMPHTASARRWYRGRTATRARKKAVARRRPLARAFLRARAFHAPAAAAAPAAAWSLPMMCSHPRRPHPRRCSVRLTQHCRIPNTRRPSECKDGRVSSQPHPYWNPYLFLSFTYAECIRGLSSNPTIPIPLFYSSIGCHHQHSPFHRLQNRLYYRVNCCPTRL